MKVFGFLVIFSMFVSFSLIAQAHDLVQSALEQFENEYPQYAGQAYLTGGTGERTWERQMYFILTRPGSYPNIQNRFTNRFGVTLPASPDDMTDEMLNWWEEQIMAQAGRPDGFAHVGGMAQDISVRNLSNDGKAALSQIIEGNGLGIIYEDPPAYYVDINDATVFHCYIQ